MNANGITVLNNYLKSKWIESSNQKAMTGWVDAKSRSLYMLSTRDPPQTKRHIQTESEGLGKVISCKWRPKESRSSNTHIIQNRCWNKDHERRIRTILNNDQGINPRKNITIINIFAPNIGACKYVRQILTSMKGEINSNTIIVGDFNTPLTPMDRSTKKKIIKETKTLNTMNQLVLIDIYRTFHPKTIKFTFFSSAHGTFSRIDNILSHKFNLSKLKNI